MALIKRSGDLTKCTWIFIVAVVLIVCGLPLMITGIAATFTASDLVGYIGGIAIFFGLGFFLVWYMFTIDSKESMLPIPEYDPSLKTISDVVNKSRANAKSTQSVGGFSNAAFVSDASEDGRVDDLTKSAVTIDGSDLDGTSNLDVETDNFHTQHSKLSPESIPQITESETEG